MNVEEKKAEAIWRKALERRDILFEVKDHINKMLQENHNQVHETAQAYFKLRDARKAKKRSTKV